MVLLIKDMDCIPVAQGTEQQDLNKCSKTYHVPVLMYLYSDP